MSEHQFDFGFNNPETKLNRYFMANENPFGPWDERPLYLIKGDWREIPYIKECKSKSRGDKVEIMANRNIVMRRSFVPDIILGRILTLYNHQVRTADGNTYRYRGEKPSDGL